MERNEEHPTPDVVAIMFVVVLGIMLLIQKLFDI